MAADPAAADMMAKRHGVPLLDRIRALRTEFGLSLATAKAVTDATDSRLPAFPEVANLEQMEAALRTELGIASARRGPPSLCFGTSCGPLGIDPTQPGMRRRSPGHRGGWRHCWLGAAGGPSGSCMG
jgi:hypothetical protein